MMNPSTCPRATALLLVLLPTQHPHAPCIALPPTIPPTIPGSARFAGEPEPLALDADRKAVTLLHQCCVEERVVDAEGVDSVVRWVAASAAMLLRGRCGGAGGWLVEGRRLLVAGCRVVHTHWQRYSARHLLPPPAARQAHSGQ